MSGGRLMPERRSDKHEPEGQSVRHPTPRSDAADVLPVLGSAGNRTMARYFDTGAAGGGAAAQSSGVWVPGRPVEVTWKQGMSERGPRRPDASRPPGMMYVGDTYAVSVAFPKNYQAQDRGNRLEFSQFRGDDSFVKQVVWTSPTEARLTIRAEYPGQCEILAFIAGNGDVRPPATVVRLVAVADAEAFHALCAAASSELRDIYDEGEKWFLECFRSYLAGYKAHTGTLEAISAREKLTHDALMALLSAGLGGIIGGAVSGVVADAVQKLHPAEGGALTTLAEDLTKVLATVPITLIPQGGDPAGGTSEVSGALPGQAGATAQGERTSTAINPLEWRTPVDILLKSEKLKVGKILTRLQKSAYRAMTTKDAHPFRDDPLKIVLEKATIAGFRLDRLPPVPAPEQFEAEFWIAWLRAYAYTLDAEREYGVLGVTENVPGEVKDRLSVIIKRLTQLRVPVMGTVREWIEGYGAPARQAAEKERSKGLHF
jgi:hypothetical protein